MATFLPFILVSTLAGAQSFDEAEALQRVEAQAQKIVQAFQKKDYDAFVTSVYPKLIEKLGGKQAMLDVLHRMDKELFDQNVRILAFDMAGKPHKPVRGGKDLFAIVPTVVRMEAMGMRIKRESFLLGISSDEGRTWTFIDGAQADRDKLKALIPHLPATLKVPEPRPVEADDAPGRGGPTGVYASEKANCRVYLPSRWSQLRPPTEEFQLAFQAASEAILISGLEAKETLEEALEAQELGQKMLADDLKRVAKLNLRVAGEPALQVRLSGKRLGIAMIIYLTCFTHQGILYRVVGVEMPGKNSQFRKDYETLLSRFEFIAERKEWLAKHEGKPKPWAVLGGRFAFTANHPRWTLDSLDQRVDYQFNDTLTLRFLSGGAWINIHVVPGRGSLDADLDQLQQFLESRLAKARTRRATYPGKDGPRPLLVTEGENGVNEEVITATVFRHGDHAVQAMVECNQTLREATQRDWQQLFKSLDEPRPWTLEPFFSPRRDDLGSRPVDPALAVALGPASAVLRDHEVFDLRGVSPDGSRGLLSTPQGTHLEDWPSRKRTPLKDRLDPRSPVAWSPDGAAVCWSANNTIVVRTSPEQTHTVPGHAVSLAFGPEQAYVLACIDEDDDLTRPLARFASMRLEKIDFRKNVRQTLLEYPLARLGHLALAPDGKRLALAANRDAPRSASFRNHVYVLNLDGTGMKQITTEPEEVLALAWAKDGKSLVALRRLSPADEAPEFATLPKGDLYRIDLAGGAAENLTRCGRIQRAWITGAEAYLAVQDFDIAASQRGVFRVPLDALAKRTANQPLPLRGSGKEAARQVGAAVRASLGMADVREMVPTTARLEAAAEAFAQALSKATGTQLGFDAASLDRLPRVLDQLEMSDPDVHVVFGAGAYYGELLRRLGQAEWKLRAVPFGQWLPGRLPMSFNPMVRTVLPWSETLRWTFHVEDGGLIRGDDLGKHLRGTKIILVYPPGHAVKAQEESLPAGYRKAQALLDAGEIKSALDLLAEELRRQPRNAGLAKEVIDLCLAAKMPQRADQLTRQAVDAGSEVPELLLRYADAIAKKQPEQALHFYRLAVKGEWPLPEACLKLGHHLASMGHSALAECAWRRAYTSASDPQRAQIRRLLDVPEDDLAKLLPFERN